MEHSILRCALFTCCLAVSARAAEKGSSLSLVAPHRWLFGIGSVAQVSVHAVHRDGSRVQHPDVVWSSSDPDIATVDPNGVVRATGFGSASIGAAWYGMDASLTFRVVPELPQEVDARRSIAFRNVHVVTMHDERVLERQTVVVRDGRIVAAGPAAEIDIPWEAETVEAEGLYLMPGLADMHTHFLHGNPHWRNDLILYAANGITTVREMWGDREFLPWRSAAASGALFAPTVYLASPGMDGPETRYGTPPVTTPEQARALVAYYRLSGFDFIKVYTYLRPEVYEAILDEARRQGIRVIGHAPPRVGYESTIASGQSSIEHISDFWSQVDSGSYYSGTLDEMKFEQLTRLMHESGVWMVPTVLVSARNTETVAEFRQRPATRYLSDEMKNWFVTAPNPTTSRDVSRVKVNLELTLRRLHEAGVRLMLGTDSGCCSVIPGFAIHDELRLAVEAGLSPYEALRLATVQAAGFLGTLNDTGTIEAGKRADLLLLEENPLDDVANAEKRAGVMIRGWWQSEKKLRAGLEEIAREYGH